MEGQTWTVAQFAMYLQVHEETVRRWIRGGHMPALNIGSAERPDYRIEPWIARAWIAQRTGSTAGVDGRA